MTMKGRQLLSYKNEQSYDREPNDDLDSRSVPSKAGRKGFDPAIRDKVIAAAVLAVEAGGIDAVKARPIAISSGISVGSIYNLFDDMDELIMIVNGQTYDMFLERAQAALDEIEMARPDHLTIMLALAKAYLDFVVDKPVIWLATLAFNRRRKEPPPAWYTSKQTALLNLVERSIAEMPGAGDPAERKIIARALWGSVHGIISVALTGGGALIQPRDEVWHQISMVVEAVAARLEGTS